MLADSFPTTKLREGFSWSTLVSMTGKIGSAVAVIFLIIILGIHDYGLYSFATVSFAMLASILELGLTTGLVKKGSEKMGDYVFINKTINSVALLNQLYTLPAIAMVSGISIALISYIPTFALFAEAILLISFALSPYGLFSILNSGLRSIHSFKSASITLILADTLTNIIGLILAVTGFGYRGAIFGRFFSYSIATLVAYLFISSKTGFRFSMSIDFATCKSIISTGLPALGITVVDSGRNWVLAAMVVTFVSVPALGVFSSILFIVQLPWFLWSDGLRIYLLPIVSSLDEKGKDNSNATIFRYGAIGTLVVGGAFCAAFVSSGYDFVIYYLSFLMPEFWALAGILMFSSLFVSLSTFSANILWGIQKQYTLFMVTAVLSTLSIIPEWFLIYYAGLNGAGFYLLVYSLILATILIRSATKLLNVPFRNRHIFGPFLSTGIAIMVGRFLLMVLINLNWIPIISYLIIASLVIFLYCLLLITMGFLTFATIRRMFQFVLGRNIAKVSP